jgi:hypothetical protein
LARTPAPFNFRGEPIKSKDGITQIVKELEEEITQSRQSAKRCRGYLDTPPWDFKRAALGYL